MKIFSNLNARIKAYREEHMGEDGFSLLELVVAVGVLLALSVGGFLAYSGITTNAKNAAAESAASTVLSGAVAYEADGITTTNPADAAKEYNGGTYATIDAAKTAGVDIFVEVEEGTGTDGNKSFTVTATNTDDTSITKVAKTGNVAP